MQKTLGGEFQSFLGVFCHLLKELLSALSCIFRKVKVRVKGQLCSDCGGRRKQAQNAASAYDRLTQTVVNLDAHSCNQMPDGMIYLVTLLILGLAPPTFAWSAGGL